MGRGDQWTFFSISESRTGPSEYSTEFGDGSVPPTPPHPPKHQNYRFTEKDDPRGAHLRWRVMCEELMVRVSEKNGHQYRSLRREKNDCQDKVKRSSWRSSIREWFEGKTTAQALGSRRACVRAACWIGLSLKHDGVLLSQALVRWGRSGVRKGMQNLIRMLGWQLSFMESIKCADATSRWLILSYADSLEHHKLLRNNCIVSS